MPPRHGPEQCCKALPAPASAAQHSRRPVPVLQFKTNKIIYRRYAGLFFSMCVDVTDNELAYLESVHLFVEILDHYFSNVCELDLVFNFHKVGCWGKLLFQRDERHSQWVTVLAVPAMVCRQLRADRQIASAAGVV